MERQDGTLRRRGAFGEEGNPSAGFDAGHQPLEYAPYIALLAARGYQVTALTGKDNEHDFLRSLGAKDVLSRNGLQMGTRPLEKSLWAGAVDAVGGDTLAWLTRTMMYGGGIVCASVYLANLRQVRGLTETAELLEEDLLEGNLDEPGTAPEPA